MSNHIYTLSYKGLGSVWYMKKKPLTFTEAEHQEINTFVIIEIILCN